MDQFEADGATPKYIHGTDKIPFFVHAVRILKRDGMGQNEIARRTRQFAKDALASYQFTEPQMPQQTICELLQGAKFAQATKLDKFRLMWVWLHVEQMGVVEEINASTADYWNPERLSRALNGLLSPGNILNQEALTKIKGRYLVYRRFYDLPDQIMVAELICGRPSIDEFSVDMPHTDLSGGAAHDPVIGCITPYGDGILFQGRFRDMGGPFIFTLRDCQWNAPGSGLSRGSGVLLAAANGERHSAYPIFLVRSDKTIKFGIMTTEEMKEDSRLWDAFEPTYNRNYVKWKS